MLNLQASASAPKFDAYEAKTIQLAGNIERQSNFIWQKKWTWTSAASCSRPTSAACSTASGVKDTRTFLIAALPASLGYDGSDNLLDPTRGFRLGGRISPEISAHGGSFTYARAQFDAQRLSPGVATASSRPAGSASGTIIGAGAIDIAPSRRFYAGGGGSVRGYGYQQLGPKDVDGDPIGGRGLAEFALEARIRLKQFGGNFGIVPVLRRRIADDRSRARLQGLAVRRRASASAIIRASGRSGSMSARRSTAQKGDGPVAVTVSLGQAF